MIPFRRVRYEVGKQAFPILLTHAHVKISRKDQPGGLVVGSTQMIARFVKSKKRFERDCYS